MTRLLVECTYVFEHPKVNSGIQRVVRNVIRELPEADETVECIPVAMLDGTLYQVHSLAPLDPRPHSPLVRLRILVERAANYFWLGQRTLEKRRPFRSSPWARRLLYVACRLFAFAFLSIPLRLLDRILGKQQPAPVRATPLEHRAGDQLVLLDSSWHADFFPLAERLKSEGVGIVSVIYDLIPLTHPQFCDAGLVKVFNHWFDWIAATADGYVAISETIRDEVRAEMLRRIGPEKVAQRWFDYFHLGSELDLVEDGASVEPDLLRMFKAKAPVFLMVSTIEPRKNHGYLLDAFERAWAQGSQARLCIAGRIGWKCEALVERVRQHPELNKRLFMFNDLSDKSLGTHTPMPHRWSSRPMWKVSACRWWRPCSAACRRWAATSRCSARSAANSWPTSTSPIRRPWRTWSPASKPRASSRPSDRSANGAGSAGTRRVGN